MWENAIFFEQTSTKTGGKCNIPWTKSTKDEGKFNILWIKIHKNGGKMQYSLNIYTKDVGKNVTFWD